jgi:hypothetical protein
MWNDDYELMLAESFCAVWRLFPGSFLSITVKDVKSVSQIACLSFYRVPLNSNIVTMRLFCCVII